MCGIAGAIGTVDSAVIEAVQRMSAAQRHRGPDSSGLWASGPGAGRTGVVLAHRRLAIIDLREDGGQPMTDPETGNIIIFNGEIYNFHTVRRELEQDGARFRSRSDTEVILKAYARWDAAQERLLFARDRLGSKPLYLCSVARPGGTRTLLFASEVRALLASNLFEREL